MRLGVRVTDKLKPMLAALGDVGVEDPLLRYLVAMVVGARGVLYASTLMSCVLTGLAWSMTRQHLFLAFVAATVVIGVVRIRVQHAFLADFAADIPRARLLAHDRKFLAWSVLFAFNLGLTSLSLIAMADVENVLPLGMTICVGYSIAFTTRGSGRIQLALGQMTAMLAPTLYGLATLGGEHGPVYALLTAITGVIAIAMAWSAHAVSVELFRANEANRHMARHDMLTGLLNRFALSDALNRALKPGQGAPGPLAIFILDIDRFKDVNDRLGHSAGDALIVTAAARLGSLAGPGDLVARLGGDEFVIVTLGVGDADQALALAGRINKAMAEPVALDGRTLVASVSIGIAFHPDHGVTGDDLLRRADIALYEAKRAGRNRARLFDAAMLANLNDIAVIDTELQGAISGDHFEPWYQPIQNIATGRIVGHEALARWRHPILGLIPPRRFIPVAEGSDAISAIARSILRKACAEAATWPPHLTISVNLSAVDFRRPADLVETVKDALAESGIDPARLYLEVTESVLAVGAQETRQAILDLARLGVRFTLDDFGAGRSSLYVIQDYPFSKIKIDRRFITHIATDRKASALILALRALSEDRDVEIVAEGVEQPLQHAALQELGVAQAQGYLYGRPSPDALVRKRPAERKIAG